MTITVIWLVVFAVVAVLAWKSWDGAFGKLIKRHVPEMLQVDDYDRYVWAVAAGILLATLVIDPAAMLLTLLLLAIIAAVVFWVARFALSKVR